MAHVFSESKILLRPGKWQCSAVAGVMLETSWLVRFERGKGHEMCHHPSINSIWFNSIEKCEWEKKWEKKLEKKWELNWFNYSRFKKQKCLKLVIVRFCRFGIQPQQVYIRLTYFKWANWGLDIQIIFYSTKRSIFGSVFSMMVQHRPKTDLITWELRQTWDIERKIKIESFKLLWNSYQNPALISIDITSTTQSSARCLFLFRVSEPFFKSLITT